MKSWSENFVWYQANADEAPDAQYRGIVRWASEARGQNPTAFDVLAERTADDTLWSAEKLGENKAAFLDILARFKAQNALLLDLLKILEQSEPVNPAVYPAIGRFDEALGGKAAYPEMQAAVDAVRADFSSMLDPDIRKYIAGDKTGPAGVNHVDLFGYVNHLKECDAGVQWALFMPELVEKQQDGFKMVSFAYKRMPAMRFIGKEEVGGPMSLEERRAVFGTLDALSAYRSAIEYDLFFMHHYGIPVDIGPWHGFFGRFMQADTPVPEGFVSFDLVPERVGGAGAPFISQCACAVFEGDNEALHRREGYDSDAMYDVTRNTMLAQGVGIPYPDKYWTAEVFLEGHERSGSAYLFSAEL